MTDPDEQNLPPAARFRALRQQIDEQLAEVRRVTRETREQNEQAQRQHRSLTEDDWRRLAAQARSGRAGPEFQEIQRRIDRGEFTWEDVFTGRAPEDVVAEFRRTVGPMRTIAEAADEDMEPEDFVRRGRVRLNLPPGLRQ